MLIGKQLYRNICDDKIPWDTQLPGLLLNRWKDWNSALTENLTVPRALTPYHHLISSLTLHAFGDASAKGVSAAVFAIVHQDQGVTQQLVCAKSRLAKKNLTIPRLELVTGHMAVNLVTNVQAAINFPPHETSLLAGLNCSALLDQGSRGVLSIEYLKQSAQDPVTRPSQVASCPNGR